MKITSNKVSQLRTTTNLSLMSSNLSKKKQIKTTVSTPKKRVALRTSDQYLQTKCHKFSSLRQSVLSSKVDQLVFSPAVSEHNYDGNMQVDLR